LRGYYGFGRPGVDGSVWIKWGANRTEFLSPQRIPPVVSTKWLLGPSISGCGDENGTNIHVYYSLWLMAFLPRVTIFESGA
jgi:hypothetical protein